MEKVTESIINVGVNDKEITLFEGQYKIRNGMAYNSYLILDEKTGVMDTVDHRVLDTWLSHLTEGLNGREVDYLVVQHMEPDHSGSVKELINRFPKIKIVGSAMTFTMLNQFFGESMQDRAVIVKEGDGLELGSHNLRFFNAPMVHWPEVIVTYEQSENIVFSADGFGKFGTRDAREDWASEAARYYFNICGKYGMQVQALLKKLAGLSISVICPLHGPVLTENLGFYMDKYNVWSSYEPEEAGVLIAYASIYGHTKEAAIKLQEILKNKGEKNVITTDLCRDDMHEAVKDAFCYDRLVLAAASYDGGMFPAMADFLYRLKSKNCQKRRVALIENGSWAPCAGNAMKAYVEEMKNMTLVSPIITIKSAMKSETITELEHLADALM